MLDFLCSDSGVRTEWVISDTAKERQRLCSDQKESLAEKLSNGTKCTAQVTVWPRINSAAPLHRTRNNNKEQKRKSLTTIIANINATCLHANTHAMLMMLVLLEQRLNINHAPSAVWERSATKQEQLLAGVGP